MQIRDANMRIEIILSNEIDKLQQQFKNYVISGHIEIGIDGTWFVVDKIEPKMKE